MIVDPHGEKVLVVECDRTIAELLRIRLDVAGYQTLLARTGRDALETLRAARPNALVIEMRLPDISGLEILRSMQLQRISIPTLVMGRDLSGEDIKKAVSLGAKDIMVKPFSGATPLERIARLLKMSAQPAAKAA